MKNNIITTGSDTQRDDFKMQWQRRQQWQEQAEKSIPNDEILLRWAEKARQTPADPEVNIIPFPTHRYIRWIPYTAAACIAIGVVAIGLNRQNKTENALPVVKEVEVGGQTVRFLCNNGCSAQDIMLSACEVIK
jgi:hypothetical protein